MNALSLCSIFLLFISIEIHTQPLYDDELWDTGYHPFPEMSRFLNSNSRIHRQSSHPSSPLLAYLCDADDKREKIEEILNTFGRKSRPLIMRIIEEDCANYHQRHKRMMTIDNNRNSFLQILFPYFNDRYQQL